MYEKLSSGITNLPVVSIVLFSSRYNKIKTNLSIKKDKLFYKRIVFICNLRDNIFLKKKT